MTDWRDRFSLSGRKALVTGASKGIGFGICEVFAQAGADIVAVGRDAAGLEEIAGLVRAQGRRCLTIQAEMATPDGPVQAAREPLGA